MGNISVKRILYALLGFLEVIVLITFGILVLSKYHIAPAYVIVLVFLILIFSSNIIAKIFLYD
ncbi:MAG: hypothetical protein AAB510_01025 [Patescibacteria group bacterium]